MVQSQIPPPLPRQLNPPTYLWACLPFYPTVVFKVSFTSEFVEDPPLLEPYWFGNGCESCTEFSSDYPRGSGAFVNVSHERSMGDWEEQAVLQASDRRSGDRFGSSLALDQVRGQWRQNSR